MVTKEESEKYYLAIGRFVCAFSNLELELKADLTTVLGLTFADGRRLLVHDFAMTCTIVESVLSNRAGDESSAELKKLIKGCRELNNHRIKIVHGFWRIGEEDRSGWVSFTKHLKNRISLSKSRRDHRTGGRSRTAG